jgi:hypothetical protein
LVFAAITEEKFKLEFDLESELFSTNKNVWTFFSLLAIDSELKTNGKLPYNVFPIPLFVSKPTG